MMDQNKDTIVSCSEFVATFMSYASSELIVPDCEDCDLIGEYVECDSENSQLGFFESLQECSEVCSSVGCEFFLYDKNDGECLWEQTTDASCPEGLRPSYYYNFYQAGQPTELIGDYEAVLIREDVSCLSESEQLGFLPTLDSCAATCW